jgi:hypothetical protein
MFAAFSRKFGRGPSRVEDFAQYKDSYERGFGALGEGQWEGRSGTRLSHEPDRDGSTVIAYESWLGRSTTNAVGWVAMGDGSSRRWSGAELRRFTQASDE